MLRNIVLIAALTFIVQAKAQSMFHEDTQGCYLPSSSHYFVQNHCLYMRSGGQLYVLRSPQLDRGLVRGVPWIRPERWQKVGGSHIESFSRTSPSFRNADVTPVVALNPNL